MSQECLDVAIIKTGEYYKGNWLGKARDTYYIFIVTQDHRTTKHEKRVLRR